MLTSLDSNGWAGMGTMPRRDGTGPSWPHSYTGGASALFVYRLGANRGLQGLRFALVVLVVGSAAGSCTELPCVPHQRSEEAISTDNRTIGSIDLWVAEN